MNPVKQAKLEKAINESDSSFCGEVRGMNLDQIKERLSKLSLDAQSIVRAKEEDEELTAAKEEVKEMGAPYREAMKKVRQKLDFLVSILEEKNV
jgi:uncharacterized protein (DUF2252 family)